MKTGDVVMTIKPCRDGGGTKVQEGRIFEVQFDCMGLFRGDKRVHVADKEAGLALCLGRSDLEVLT